MGDPHLQVHNPEFENLTWRWPLSQGAQKYAGFIARWSWGWLGSKRTPERPRIATPGKIVPAFWPACGMSRAHCYRARAECIRAGVIFVNDDDTESINKHMLRKLVIAVCRTHATTPKPPLVAPTTQNCRTHATKQAEVVAPTQQDDHVSLDLQLTSEVRKTKNLKTTKTKNGGRPPTPAEEVFGNGYEKKYGSRPRIARGHAIEIGKLVTTYGIELVTRKIARWFTMPLGRNFTGRRGPGAFVTWWDSIEPDGPGGVAGAESTGTGGGNRFDRATERTGTGN